MAGTTSQRDWANWAWTELFGYPFDDWASERVERSVSARQLSREVAAMTGGRATVSPNTLASWFPDLVSDDGERDTKAVA